MMSNAARAFLGVPWKHQGRDRLGIDCIGLVVSCLRECGHVPPDRTDYGRDPNGELVAALVANCTQVPMQEGAIALVRYGPELRHVGIIGSGHDGLTLIHADSHQRRVVEHPIDARWRKRIVSCWEYVS